tara:strand:- start:56 stop:619 length:564 start_codon:yes stop_codon:yes gene_type:complete
MNNQNLIIYDFQILFDILNEIESDLNFKLINSNKKDYSKTQFNKLKNFLTIAKQKNSDLKNQIEISNFPLEIFKLVEIININFLKNKFNQQSDIDMGLYKLNFNSRTLYNNKNQLDLTEKESDIIIFLKKSIKPVTINQLQTKVWGHNSKLETHTVETHIYRLRKKITEKFNDNKFIISSKTGYIIN